MVQELLQLLEMALLSQETEIGILPLAVSLPPWIMQHSQYGAQVRLFFLELFVVLIFQVVSSGGLTPPLEVTAIVEDPICPSAPTSAIRPEKIHTCDWTPKLLDAFIDELAEECVDKTESKMVGQTLEALPVAPPPKPQPLTKEELKHLEEQEEDTLHELRIFLRDVTRRLAIDRRLRAFTKPVELEEGESDEDFDQLCEEMKESRERRGGSKTKNWKKKKSPSSPAVKRRKSVPFNKGNEAPLNDQSKNSGDFPGNCISNSGQPEFESLQDSTWEEIERAQCLQ
ncbi:hypothetical protein ASZ78_012659, partial [Callipepla squamata]